MGKRRLPPEKKDMNKKLQITMDEVQKLRDKDPVKAFDTIKNTGIDLTTAPELWEIQIILLEKLGRFKDSFLAASEYAKDCNIEGTVNAELVKILGDGEMSINRNYSRAYYWYEVGSVTEDASLLAHFKKRGPAARKLCALHGSKSDIRNMIQVLCSYSQREEVMELIDTAKEVPKESSLSKNFKAYALAKLGSQDEAFEIARSYIGDRTPEQVAADKTVFTFTAGVLATGFSKAGKHKDAVQWYTAAKKKAKQSGDVEQAKYYNGLAHCAVTMDEVQKLRDKDPGKAFDTIKNSGIDLTTAPELWQIQIILLEKLGRFKDSFLAASKYANYFEIQVEDNNTVKCSNVVELVRILCNGGIKFKHNYAKAYAWYKYGVSITKDESLLDSFNQMGQLARTRCAEKGSEGDITEMIEVLCYFRERENVMELIETAKTVPKGSLLSEKFKIMASTMLDDIGGEISEGLIEDKKVKSSSDKSVAQKLVDDSLPSFRLKGTGEKLVKDWCFSHFNVINSSEKSVAQKLDDEAKVGEEDVERAVVPNSLQFSSKLVFVDVTLVDDRVWVGKMKNSHVSIPKTFIKATYYQVQDFEMLLSMREENEYILGVDYIEVTETLEPEVLEVLICEEVETLDYFFRKEFKSFKQSQGRKILDAGSKKAWWNQIASKFYQIFRDVVRGLILLFFSKNACGNLSNSIYVTKYGRGKILPPLDPSSTESHDIGSLRKKMQSILVLPSDSWVHDSTSLPNGELRHFFRFVHIEKLKIVDAWWLIDHPYFWTSQERFEFINQLLYLMKRRVISA